MPVLNHRHCDLAPTVTSDHSPPSGYAILLHARRISALLQARVSYALLVLPVWTKRQTQNMLCLAAGGRDDFKPHIYVGLKAWKF